MDSNLVNHSIYFSNYQISKISNYSGIFLKKGLYEEQYYKYYLQ